MTLQSLDMLIGRQLRDSYGRHFGTIAGITTDESGNIRSIGVDAGCNGFQTIEGSQIAFEDDSPVLVADWKMKADGLLKTSGLAQKRMQALEELLQEGEINPEVYEQLASRHKAQFDIYAQDCDDTVVTLNVKAGLIRSENGTIHAFLGNLKLQHRIREIDDSTYQSTSEYLGTILQRNDKEATDISAVLDTLTPQETSTEAEIATVEEPISDIADASVPEDAVEATEDLTSETPAVAVETAPDVAEELSPETPDASFAADEQDSSSTVPEMTITSPENIPMAVEEPISVNTESQSSEAVDTYFDSAVPEEVSSSPEDISGDADDQMFEAPSMDQPEALEEPSVEAVPDVSDDSEQSDYDAPDEGSDVSDRMPVDDMVSSDDQPESSDSDDSEISDSVSFGDEETESTETPSSDENTETPDDSADSDEDPMLYSTQ